MNQRLSCTTHPNYERLMDHAKRTSGPRLQATPSRQPNLPLRHQSNNAHQKRPSLTGSQGETAGRRRAGTGSMRGSHCGGSSQIQGQKEGGLARTCRGRGKERRNGSRGPSSSVTSHTQLRILICSWRRVLCVLVKNASTSKHDRPPARTAHRPKNLHRFV